MLGLGAHINRASLSGATSSFFSNEKSLFTDGVDDYFDISLPSDIFDKNNGSISVWLKIDSSQATTAWFLEAWDSTDPLLPRIALQYFNVSGSTFALNGQYMDEVSPGAFAMRFCGAKTSSLHHGKPWNRIAADYGAFDAPFDSMYDAGAMRGSWHHVVLTWDTSATYTDPTDSTEYTGRMELYLDGTKVNFGQGAYVANGQTASAEGLRGIPATTVFDNFRIGARLTGGNAVDSLFDEVAVYDKTLSAAEVSQIYNSGKPGDLSAIQSGSNLVGWWRFEDNTDDSSSNSYSGTLVNGATYNSDIPS